MDNKIKLHFKKTDPILYKLHHKLGEPNIKISARHPRLYFRSLCADIISQQLSGHVADVLWHRFVFLFRGKQVSPSRLLLLSDLQLRIVGISNSKAGYLKDLARYHVDQLIQFDKLDQLSDEGVIQELTKVKGVGRWTAEMFLMFTLGRQDVFSAGDQGLKNAIKKHYSSPPNPVIWSPYRTIACLILWKSLKL